MDKISKILFIGSGLLFLAGLFWHFFGRQIPWSKFPFGRLPGDIYIKKGDSSFYFPIVTCLLISILLSIIIKLIKK